MLAEPFTAPVSLAYKTETQVEIALLVCALFLQRFFLPFAGMYISLILMTAPLILLYQFLRGKLVIQYDRLLWFLVAELVVTCSLLLNYKSTMLSSYFLLMVSYSLVTLSRPSSADRYESTLRAFQSLVMIISCLAVAQFFAQFVVDGRRLIMFYGIIPDFLLGPSFEDGGWHTINPLTSSLIKSNGIFLGEPSTLSQITAVGILIEISEFRRPRYLFVMAFGLLVAYSGTGLILLLIFLPLVSLQRGEAALAALLVVMIALGLFATGIVDLSSFLGRVNEFNDTRDSGFVRFVAPFWLAAENLDTASLQALLVGGGPGTTRVVIYNSWHSGFGVTWLKLFLEYGIFGSFIFIYFIGSCFRKAICPGLLGAVFGFYWLFVEGVFLGTGFIVIAMVLCTLHVYEPRQRRSDETSLYQPILAAGSRAN
jgi:hypothetical protein